MKRSSNLLEEQFLKASGRSFSKENNLEDQQFFVFVTDINHLEIKYTNLKARSYLNDEYSFRKVIHPEDYQDFLLHLRSLESLKSDSQEEIEVRIKTQSRTWKKYLFTHRIYEGHGSSKERLVLGTAKELKATGKKERNNIPRPGLQKSLSTIQNKYKSLISALDEGFCIIDLLFDSKNQPVDYLFVEVNTAFEEHLGIWNVVHKTVREMIPELEDYWFQNYAMVASTRKSVHFRSFAENINRSWFAVHAFPVGDDEKGLVGVVFSDVTVQENLKRTTGDLGNKIIRPEEKLEQNYKLLHAIFENTRIGTAVLEPVYRKNGNVSDFIYLHTNKMICKQLGQPLVGKRFTETSSSDEVENLFSALKRTIVNGEQEEFQIKLKDKAQNRWHKITTRSIDGLLIISREDITRRKTKAQRLKENIRFRKQIAETSPDIIMILNLREDNVRYINRDLGADRGMRKKEIDGMTLGGIIPFIHPYDREAALKFHARLIQAKDKEILDLEFRLKSEDEYWEWFNARGKVFMKDKKNNVCEYILLLRNIEQQKRTQRALLHAEKLSIKGEVARTLAHELRNPMASIAMAADILSQKTAGKGIENVEMENYIGVIKRSTGILNRLVTDLLNSSNYSPIVPVKCCLAKTLEEALKAAEDRIYLTGIQVVKEYQGVYNILADPEKLKIALLNIIINASEAIKSDKGIIQLKIVRNTNNHCLTITDNGCGMEQTQLEKLFDAFYTQKPQGVGIGLSSVKSILEDHDATIMVESKINEGTSFHLTFHNFESFQRT